MKPAPNIVIQSPVASFFPFTSKYLGKPDNHVKCGLSSVSLAHLAALMPVLPLRCAYHASPFRTRAYRAKHSPPCWNDAENAKMIDEVEGLEPASKDAASALPLGKADDRVAVPNFKLKRLAAKPGVGPPPPPQPQPYERGWLARLGAAGRRACRRNVVPAGHPPRDTR